MSAIKPLLVWLAVVAAVVAGLAMTYSDGYHQGFALAKAQGDAALSERIATHEAELRSLAEAAAVGLQKAANDLLEEQTRGSQLAAELGAKRDELRATTDKLRGEIQHVTNLYRRALDATPEQQPPAVFTAGFVRVWNSALFGTGAAGPVPATGTASSGANAPGAGPNPADDLIVGITRADLLENQVRNSEGYASCRAQLNKLIEWNSKNGRK